MNWNWRSLIRLRSAAARAGSRPKVDRRAVVVVERASDADDLMLDLSAARVDSVRLLSLSQVGSGAARDEESPEARAWRVLHPHREGRVRAWSLDEVIAGNAITHDAMLADVAIVPIQVDHLLDVEATTNGAFDVIQGALLAMKRQGRLRRVAIVIAGDPRQMPLHHPSQARLPDLKGESVSEALASELRRGETPGHPLGDPAWAHFLREQFLARAAFLAFLESVRRLASRHAAVFFVAQGEAESPGIDQLVSWIDRPGGGEGYGKTPGRLGFRAVTAAVVTAAVVFLALPPFWIGEPTGDVPSPRATLEKLERHLRGYDAVLGLPGALLGSRSARAEVERARDVVRDEVAVDALRTQLEDRVSNEISNGLFADDVARRLEVAERIEQELRVVEELLLPVLDDARGRFATKSARARDRLWTSLARAQTAIAFLRLEARNRGFDGFTLDSTQDSLLAGRWRGAGREEIAERVRHLSSRHSASEFYREFARWAVDPRDANLSWAALAPALPRLRQVDAISARRMDEFDVLGRTEFAGFVEPSRSERPMPRTMTLRFTNPGDGSWHVDVARAGGRFVAARWIAGAAAADGCQLQLPEATSGEVLRVDYCSVSRDHVLLSGRETDGPGDIRSIVLDQPTGQVKFAHGVVLDYVVTAGWAADPPRPEGVRP